MAHLRPRFGALKQHSSYYEKINALIITLRESTTLNNIAIALNQLAVTTPNGFPWNKSRLSNYCRLKGL